MIDLEQLIRMGRFWWVHADLDKDETLVIPTPLRRGPVDSQNQRFSEERGLVILGLSYTYVAGAASVGFDLLSQDDAFSDGVTSNFTIWGDRSQAAGRVSHHMSDLCIPLSLAEALSTPANGALLKVDVTSTAPTFGSLLVWGIETSDSISKYTSGSPVTFPST